MHLYRVSLFYHPSGDHMDPSADWKEEFFTLSDIALGASAIEKVTDKLRQRGRDLAHYKEEANWLGLSTGITPEQALKVLRVVGLNVIE